MGVSHGQKKVLTDILERTVRMETPFLIILRQSKHNNKMIFDKVSFEAYLEAYFIENKEAKTIDIKGFLKFIYPYNKNTLSLFGKVSSSS